MDYTDLSDLEEGEILEYESSSPSDSRCDDIKLKSSSYHSLKKEYKSCNFQFRGKQESNMYICMRRRDDNINKNLRNKWKFGEKLGNLKSNVSMIDLESISSEEEHKSDEENKYSSENKKCAIYSERRNGKKKQSSQFYGTVEDIMSEIGETICRKSGCNYKKRKSKAQRSLDRYSDKSYDLWSHNIFSSHFKNKKHKRSISFSDSNSDSDTAKDRLEKPKKKRKKRGAIYEEEKKSRKNSHVRDFDEMRRALLEKLKQQKAEEKSKASSNECALEIENPEIQEVNMLIDCTNYVDNPRDAVPEDSPREVRVEENEREDELDLVKLRLIALASNKKQKCTEPTSKALKTDEDSEMKKSLDNSNEEVDLDRNELLLRAEALKTALLKKHQKILNRLKVKKTENTKDRDVDSTERSITCVPSEEVNGDLDADACKENMKNNKEAGSFNHDSNAEVKVNELNQAPLESSGSLKKTHPKPRTKRKKRKSCSFASNLKENNDRSEAFEEDDRTLRSQLLNDLMKKKSLKEEKPVLLESVQASANQPPSTDINLEPPKKSRNPMAVTRKILLNKVNPPKTVKPVMGSVIPKAEIQRIIVHLGSEDSSDDETPCQAPSGPGTGENQGEEKESKDSDAKLTEANKAIHADYERSVELLLSQARKKIEGEKRTAEECNLATPEAVYKHLPLSQRLEYIRLKQKIAERERLRKESAFAPVNSKAHSTSTEGVSQRLKSEPGNVLKAAIKPVASSSSGGSVHKSASKPVVLHTPSTNGTVGLSNFGGLKAKETTQRRVLNKTKVNLQCVRGKELPAGKEQKNPISTQSSRLLLPSSQALISKLKLLLKKIKIEKIIEENYEKEMIKLKNQLNLLEKKKNEQRFKIKKLGEESMKTYKAIQGITAKTNEKTVEEKHEGVRNIKEGDDAESKSEEKKKEMAKEKKEETEGKQMSNEPEVELSKAQSETDKRPNNEDKTCEIAKETLQGVCLLNYQSPLQAFNKVSYSSERVDPNVMMCQFDLTGVCKDEECAYQHLRNLPVVGRKIVAAPSISE